MKKIHFLFVALFACAFFFTGCKKDEYLVTFDPNGGIGEMPTQIFATGVPQILLPNAFYFEKYEFIGWSKNPNGKGKIFLNEQSITVTEDMTLYAQWLPTINTYFVLFYANGGTGSMENQSFSDNKYEALSANTFKRAGYIFTGWNTKSDGSGDFYRNEETIRLNANLALYAQWTNNTGGGQPCPGIPTVNDIDGNTYNTVQIGSQCWLKENLRTTKYNTGADIPIITDNEQWYSVDYEPAMCYYNNNATYAAIYGALYNGYAVNKSTLCPDGWHVPSDAEWNVLAVELGGIGGAGYLMKTVYDWSSDWYGGDGNGSNESGFSAFPAGYRNGPYIGSFSNMGNRTVFWCSTNESYYWKKTRTLDAGSKELISTNDSNEYGLSVRCIKD